MEIKSYKISKLPRIDRTRISKLHMPFGDMWPTFLWQELEQSNEATIILAKDDGLIVGWAILYKAAKNNYLANNHNTKPHTWIQIYVQRKYRRQGIGSEIIKRAKKINKNTNIRHADWSDEATAFFSRHF